MIEMIEDEVVVRDLEIVEATEVGIEAMIAGAIAAAAVAVGHARETVAPVDTMIETWDPDFQRKETLARVAKAKTRKRAGARAKV